MSQRFRLFVYGTLRAGQPAHNLLAGQPFLAHTRTVTGYALLDLGDYPAMISADEGTVVGEVYDIDADTLKKLDAYEGFPTLYCRVEVPLVDGSRAHAYQLVGARNSPRIAGGDWLGRQKTSD